VPTGITGCAPESKLFDGGGAEAVRISDESLSGSAAGVAFATCVLGSEAGAGFGLAATSVFVPRRARDVFSAGAGWDCAGGVGVRGAEAAVATCD